MNVTQRVKDGKPCAPFKVRCYNGRVNPRPTTKRGKRRTHTISSDMLKALYAEGDAIERR